jgi:DNA-binding MarR family transcriptional regulator
VAKRRKIMKLTEKSLNVFNCVKENGGRVSIDAICETLGLAARSVNANVTDLTKKGLVIRDKVAGEGEDAKDVTFVVLTDEGAAFVPGTDAE